MITRWGVLNAKEKGGIAVPSVFVVDSELRVRLVAVEEVYRRLSPGDVLEFIRSTQGAETTNRPRMRKVKPGRMFLRAIASALRYGVHVKRE
jgi:alkyl hydroperoxide reductase subunit AhpC